MNTLDITRDYTLNNAKAFVRCAADAYNYPHDIETETAHIHVTQMPDAQVVAFRGTASIEDWITDIHVLRQRIQFLPDVPCGSVCEGFYKSTYGVIDQVMAKLNKDIPIFTCGHSLGGAQAALSLLLLKMRGFNTYHCYTYGQPRLGDKIFKAFFDKTMPGRLSRFCNGADIIPWAPSWLFGNRHSGVMHYLKPAGGVAVTPAMAMIAVSDFMDWWGDWATNRKLALLDDHHIAHYVAKVLDLKI